MGYSNTSLKFLRRGRSQKKGLKLACYMLRPLHLVAVLNTHGEREYCQRRGTTVLDYFNWYYFLTGCRWLLSLCLYPALL